MPPNPGDLVWVTVSSHPHPAILIDSFSSATEEEEDEGPKVRVRWGISDSEQRVLVSRIESELTSRRGGGGTTRDE